MITCTECGSAQELVEVWTGIGRGRATLCERCYYHGRTFIRHHPEDVNFYELLGSYVAAGADEPELEDTLEYVREDLRVLPRDEELMARCLDLLEHYCRH